eukprot:CAMPEP_0116543880 /NCGR_PEP_ID=MMETSP0397-20121206/1809_1 /TAXON_ID=216820 /ORGANISM="Cyclophora tenuis, Strain ECT3854" /LENGTH=143 /DNA_ID=CAMNT_0004068033 /DNA_START=1261 /DNA_END=1689 /DNA_ORIENTATION=-
MTTEGGQKQDHVSCGATSLSALVLDQVLKSDQNSKGGNNPIEVKVASVNDHPKRRKHRLELAPEEGLSHPKWRHRVQLAPEEYVSPVGSHPKQRPRRVELAPEEGPSPTGRDRSHRVELAPEEDSSPANSHPKQRHHRVELAP